MGLLFDLAVVGVSVLVVASLVLLAWTIAVGGTAAADRGRRHVADARATIAAAEGGFRATRQAEGDGPTA